MKASAIGSLILAAIISASSADAQNLPKEMTKRIDNLFASFDTAGSPGCALGIYRDGKLVYGSGYGSADLEHDVPITTKTVFDIGSTSKQFTAAAIMMLAQQGKLSLDDEIQKYLPEIPGYGTPITIRHLLAHTSGLRDYIALLTLNGHDIDDVTSDDDALTLIARQQGLDFPTGSEHAYSNTGYFLLSIIIERAASMTLREYAAAELFEPLGMSRTSFIDDHTEIVPNRAIAYAWDDERGRYRRDVSGWEQNGDGGLFTTVEDLLQWDRNFYDPEVGGTRMLDDLLRRGTLDDGGTLDYAAGLMHDVYRGLSVVSHGGAWGGYRAELMRIPSETLSVAILCNCGEANPTRLARRVIDEVLVAKLPPPPPSTLDKEERAVIHFEPEDFDPFIGDFALEEAPDFIISFARDGDRYFTQATGQNPIEMFPASDSTFDIAQVGATVTFHREVDGTVSSVTLDQGGPMLARRVEPLPPNTFDLDAYAGSYYSPELDVTYTVVVDGDQLLVTHPRYGTARLAPPMYDEEGSFTGDQWFAGDVGFEIEDGEVGALVLSFGRVGGIRFGRVE